MILFFSLGPLPKYKFKVFFIAISQSTEARMMKCCTQVYLTITKRLHIIQDKSTKYNSHSNPIQPNPIQCNSMQNKLELITKLMKPCSGIITDLTRYY